MEKSLGNVLMEVGKLQREEGELVLEMEDKVVRERSWKESVEEDMVRFNGGFRKIRRRRR